LANYSDSGILDYGQWTERFARQVSSRGGQPDFVYKAIEVKKGRATREIGDHLLLLGHQLVVVSVKSRNIVALGRDDDDRARSWLSKAIAAAARQIEGTRRTLWAVPALRLVSDRGIEVPWDPSRVTEVYGAIVLNYMAPERFVPTLSSRTPTITLLAEHWTEAHRVLGSTSNFIAYVRGRTGLQEQVPLELELDLLGAQLEAEASETSHVPVRNGAWESYLSRHPEAVFGGIDDHRYALVVDAMISRAHEQDPSLPPLRSPYDYLDTIEILDRLSLETRVDFGKKVFEKCRLAREGNRPRYFGMQDGNDGMIFFLSDVEGRPKRPEFLQALTFALHTKTVEDGSNSALRTLGIATEAWPNSGGSHDFALVKGRFGLDEEARQKRDNLLKDFWAPPRPVDENVLRRLNDSLP